MEFWFILIFIVQEEDCAKESRKSGQWVRGKPEPCGVVEANRRQVLKEGLANCVEHWRKVEENDTTNNLAKCTFKKNYITLEIIIC